MLPNFSFTCHKNANNLYSQFTSTYINKYSNLLQRETKFFKLAVKIRNLRWAVRLKDKVKTKVNFLLSLLDIY